MKNPVDGVKEGIDKIKGALDGLGSIMSRPSKKKVDFSVLSLWAPAHSDCYNVYFEHTTSFDDNINIMKISDTSKIFPATSVEEHLANVEYEEIRFIDGLTVPFPVALQEHGYVTITFQEDINWSAHKYLREWMTKWVDKPGTMRSPDDMIRNLVIEKLDLSGNVVARSEYGVLPPDNLRATNSQANSVVEDSISLRVVKVIQTLD